MDKIAVVKLLVEACLESEKDSESQIFFDYAPHCNVFDIRIFASKWESRADPDKIIIVHLGNEKEVREAIALLNEFPKKSEEIRERSNAEREEKDLQLLEELKAKYEA